MVAALDMAESGRSYETARLLETLRYREGVNPELVGYVEELVRRTGASGEGTKINIPADYNRGLRAMFHPPFRTISDKAAPPKPFPTGMALPRIIGNANDYSFIEEAAALSGSVDPALAIDIVHPFENKEALAALLASVEAQDYGGRVRLHLFGEAPPVAKGFSAGELVHHQVPLPSAEANELLLRVAGDTDLLMFVSGFVTLEPEVLRRIAYVAAVSDTVVHALVPQDFDASLTPLTTSASRKHLSRSYPFRDICGLNFAMPASLYRNSGGLDARFSTTYHAARELCFRFYNSGCYLRPVTTPVVRDFRIGNSADGSDGTLFRQLCPNHWDRRHDGQFEVPKISVYIPAYNAGRFIASAVESVLNQDVEDLEVCIADDGSRDDTLDVLERHFAGNPKVRWSTNPNGGIGFASNRAISMARGLYIGQLDSDDRLKPGALRTLATYLDDHPDVVCCYGSCERIDADGEYLQKEYSWPVFSREKMMVTSITHHFRMFRKQAWERTEKFREDIINAVDYDMFLKLSEVGSFHHVDEILYQRRWHGANTSNVNESFQTANAHRVQREALKRLGLFKFWDIHIADPKEPRRVTYRRRPGRKLVMFWPYYRANAYQRMLYAIHSEEMEICAGTIDAAIREIEKSANPEDHVFHLHWLNFLFRDGMSEEEAREAADAFVAKVEQFKSLGGTVMWTIHNTISHEVVHHDVEVALSTRLAEIADVLHFHSESSIAEVGEAFPIPQDKVRIAPHGHFIGAYPDLASPQVAREYLGLAPTDDVILFTGQVRKYKGIDALIAAFRKILADRPNAMLVIAGAARGDPLAGLDEPLTDLEGSRIRLIDRFIDDAELPVFLRAADFAVYPYRKILTSSSLMLALSFDLPVIMPDVGMARDVIGTSSAGILYDGSAAELESAIARMLAAKDSGQLEEMRQEARRVARTQEWQRLF